MGTLAVTVFIHFIGAFSRLEPSNILPVILLTVAIVGILLTVVWVRDLLFKK